MARGPSYDESVGTTNQVPWQPAVNMLGFFNLHCFCLFIVCGHVYLWVCMYVAYVQRAEDNKQESVLFFQMGLGIELMAPGLATSSLMHWSLLLVWHTRSDTISKLWIQCSISWFMIFSLPVLQCYYDSQMGKCGWRCQTSWEVWQQCWWQPTDICLLVSMSKRILQTLGIFLTHFIHELASLIFLVFWLRKWKPKMDEWFV